MALEKIFRDLARVLQTLREDLQAVQITLREDVPADGGVVLVDRFADAVDDSIGSLEECLAAADAGREALAARLEWDRAVRALTTCQEQFHSVELRFRSELVSYERLRELISFGRRRGGEWVAWTKSVRQGLDACNQPFEEAKNALLACWQGIAERPGSGCMQVKSAVASAGTGAEELVGRASP